MGKMILQRRLVPIDGVLGLVLDVKVLFILAMVRIFLVFNVDM